jgi:hypothetical protein
VLTGAEKGSAESDAPQAGSGRNGARISIRTITGTHASLTSSRSQHVRITAQLARKQEYRTRQEAGNRTPLVEFRHYTAYPKIPEATWAQPLSREELS